MDRMSMSRYFMYASGVENSYPTIRGHGMKHHCIMGNDYYGTNEHLVEHDGGSSPSGEIFGYYVITKQYYDRYRELIAEWQAVLPTQSVVLSLPVAPPRKKLVQPPSSDHSIHVPTARTLRG